MELKKPLVVIAAAVAAAFEGILPPERAAEAKVVVADAGSSDVATALSRGQSVIEIGGMKEQPMCRAHLGERIAESGRRHIFAYGLALDQPFPEAVAILDGLVDRARRPLRAHARPLRPQLRPLAHVAPHTAATSAAVPVRPKGL